MMYLVSTFAAGAAAVELRNLAVDATNNKILFNGHGFADGDVVLASGAIGGGTVADTMYVVDSKTTNDFKLKTFKAADATGDTAVTFSGTGGAQATLKKFGAKKCLVATTEADDDKVTCTAATTFALADKLRIYCTATGDACKLDAAGNADLASGKTVWAREANQTAFTLAKAKPTDATTPAAVIAIAQDAASGAQSKTWLLSEDTGSIYAAAPKTLIADGGKWSSSTDYSGSATDLVAVCGNAACTIADGAAYFYTAGSVATTGLTDKKVYYGVVAAATPWQFKLKAANVSAATLSAGTAVAVTTSGNGDSYQKVNAGYRMTGSTATDNKIHIEGDTTSHLAENQAVIFYCSDTTTAADCDYKVAGGSNGAEFKIKGTHSHSSGTTKGALKAATAADGCTTGGTGTAGCADVAVSEDTASKTKGYLLKKDASAAVIFPAAAAGSAARSFAMLGSAVAMATAFLLA